MTLPLRFRMLAVPFSGPIPKKGSPAGVDLDGEFFTRHTATGLSPYSEVKVLFHHGLDPLKFLKDARLGTATNWRRDAAGWRCDVELIDSPQTRLVQHLSDRVDLYGSTAASHRQRDETGHITSWPVTELSLSPAPQNIFSIPYWEE